MCVTGFQQTSTISTFLIKQKSNMQWHWERVITHPIRITNKTTLVKNYKGHNIIWFNLLFNKAVKTKVGRFLSISASLNPVDCKLWVIYYYMDNMLQLVKKHNKMLMLIIIAISTSINVGRGKTAFLKSDCLTQNSVSIYCESGWWTGYGI